MGDVEALNGIYDRFLVPTAQDEDPIGDPDLFYTMYFIGFGGEDPRTISVTNKFREDQQWTVSESFALWNPSLKQMPGGPPPIRNHYKCYVADGPIIDAPAMLADQFDTLSVTVIEPAYWCNPVEKQIDGRVFEIVDENAWLGCYFVDPPSFFDPPIPVNITDQFGVIDQELVSRQILCVPSLKAGPVPTEGLSWGQLKVKFR